MSITIFGKQDSPHSPSGPPAVDIVAVHGLYEGALETWTDPETTRLWLRDLFPHERLNVRILVYGYSADKLASPGEGTGDRLLPYATSLVAELCAERELSNAFERPIIFVCHGFGGILVKKALVFSSTSRAKHVEHRRSIFISTHAILFLGTPHNGMSKDVVLASWKGKGDGPSQFMLSLLKRSEMLQEITDQFAPLMKQFSISYLWEQLETRFRKVATYVVDEGSAAPIWENVDRCGIQATHSGMVKFKNYDDPGYRVILGALVRCIKAAPKLIELRWTNDRQLLAEERRGEAEALLRGHSRDSTDAADPLPAEPNELYVVPRCSTNYFTGRRMHAKILKDKFGLQGQSSKQEHKIFVIYGLGGSGKTQFCLKYIEDNRSSYWGIFWIDASSDETAEAGFAYLGQQAGKGATFAAGMHWLSNCTQTWFLVIDNADDPDMDVSKYFPTGGRGHILITTRNPEAIFQATIGDFRFRGMDPEEAITLLLRSAHVADQSDDARAQNRTLAQGIASELGYLALAIAHAGATIRRKIYTLEKYLHYYLGHRKNMLSYPRIQDADEANIITTWEIPFQRIASRKAAEYRDAVDVMHIFAFMHFESIPEVIFQKFWNTVNGTESKLIGYPDILQNKSVWNEEAHARVRRAYRVLCDHSIIDHDSDMGTCSLHPVIHSWARSRLDPVEQRRWVGYTTSVLAHCISPDLEASGREFRRRLLPHIDSCVRALKSSFPSFPKTLEQAAGVAKFASVYAENGLWHQARSLQREVIELRAKKLGKWHKETIDAQRSLGYIYWNLFEVRAAVEIQVQILKAQFWSRPLSDWTIWPPWQPEHISYCTALSDLTMTLWLAGKRDLSKRAGERAVEGLIKGLGPDDPITLTAIFNLARTYLHLGSIKKSHAMLTIVVQKRKRFFGSDHPDTLLARNELGIAYRALGRFKLAEILVMNVLGARKRTLGEEHAYTLWSVNDLSKIRCDRGRAEEAVSMLEAIVPVVIRTLGEEHVGMFMTRSNLARAYALCGMWNEAEGLLRKLTEVIPTSHPDWIHTMCGYVHVQARQGRLHETEADCNKLLDHVTDTKALSMDDPRIIAIGEFLLQIYQDQGRAIDASKLKKRISRIEDKNDAQETLFSILFGASGGFEKSPTKHTVSPVW